VVLILRQAGQDVGAGLVPLLGGFLFLRLAVRVGTTRQQRDSKNEGVNIAAHDGPVDYIGPIGVGVNLDGWTDNARTQSTGHQRLSRWRGPGSGWRSARRH